ncbi:hypothetical protein [Rhodopirellula europaea]|uniref:hypothetical protein n=1 Tax=Rhodopirellula europaea TaxID=1263866 RepID=UPI003D2D0F1E
MPSSEEVEKSREVQSLIQLHGMPEAEAFELVCLPRSDFRECSQLFDHLPTPEQITEQAAMIRDGWTDDERIKRRRSRPKVFECDPGQIHRDALAKLETRQAKREAVMVVEDTSRRGDAVPWELEPLALG